jgi:hypothetical protein
MPARSVDLFYLSVFSGGEPNEMRRNRIMVQPYRGAGLSRFARLCPTGKVQIRKAGTQEKSNARFPALLLPLSFAF